MSLKKSVLVIDSGHRVTVIPGNVVFGMILCDFGMILCDCVLTAVIQGKAAKTDCIAHRVRDWFVDLGTAVPFSHEGLHLILALKGLHQCNLLVFVHQERHSHMRILFKQLQSSPSTEGHSRGPKRKSPFIRFVYVTRLEIWNPLTNRIPLPSTNEKPARQPSASRFRPH
jgi:hypothetical protein